MAGSDRFLCHDCGERFPEEEDDLRCPYCGAKRDMVEDTERKDDA